MAITRLGVGGPAGAYPDFSPKAENSAGVGLVTTLGDSSATIDVSLSSASIALMDAACAFTLSHSNQES